MKYASKLLSLLFSFLLLMFSACEENYTPKPRGYFRIDLPAKSYQLFDDAIHYSFEYSVNAQIEKDQSNTAAVDWFTVHYPQLHADLYLSYKQIDSNLPLFLEDARTMAFKHLPKANSISDSVFHIAADVSGLFYFINGKGVASPIQFYVTDSTHNFVRAALYFNFRPNNDSISPVIQHLKADLLHMVESFKWKKSTAVKG
jgi:gliding motility-associated lipoprotein GldD